MSYEWAVELAKREAEIERLKVSFKTLHAELDNAQATIREKDALIAELTGTISKRVKPFDKDEWARETRALLDRTLSLKPGDPQRRAAEAGVQQMAERIGRREMER